MSEEDSSPPYNLPQTYARRKRVALGIYTDVYEYDKISDKLRRQIEQIIKDTIGHYYHSGVRAPGAEIYDYIVKSQRRELGVDNLTPYEKNSENELYNYMRVENDIDEYLTVLEMILNLIAKYVRKNIYKFQNYTSMSPDEAILEINARMQEAGFGYQYDAGNIIKIDSYILHKEVVAPVLNFLSNEKFKSANSEYLKAHKAFREGNYENCLVECAKAFESVLKIIGAERGWGVAEHDPASKLIEAAAASGFLAAYTQSGFNSLRSMLESGVPTIRNRSGGHGAGIIQRIVPKELAAFQLHQAGAAILFLVESHEAQS